MPALPAVEEHVGALPAGELLLDLAAADGMNPRVVELEPRAAWVRWRGQWPEVEHVCEPSPLVHYTHTHRKNVSIASLRNNRTGQC